MRNLFVFGLCLLLLFSGCSMQPIPTQGDFSLDLPEGYAFADITDKTCSVISESDNNIIGGMELTTLTKKDLNGKHTDKITNYLMEDFHQTYNVEYLASHWGKHHKIVIIHLDKAGIDGQEDHFSHIFFEKDSGIYHLWLDLNIVDYDTESQFKAITGVD